MRISRHIFFSMVLGLLSSSGLEAAVFTTGIHTVNGPNQF